MQLVSVRLKNFMIHRDKTINFKPGINVIRGENEKGKSSVLFGISYNWFGAGFLPQILEETVTWGFGKTSLFTETVFLVKGETYTCQRSLKGAELYRGQFKKGHTNPLVTGQKEVSVAIANLFDLPNVQSASKLIIAPQDNIRGIISLGSVAAASFIEELIDMKDVDNLIKDLSTRLTHSHDAKNQAIAQLEDTEARILELPKLESTDEVDNKLKEIAPEQDKLLKQNVEAQDADIEAGYRLRECRSGQERNEKAVNTAEKDIEKIDGRIAKQKGVHLVTLDEISKAEDMLKALDIYTFYDQELLPLLNKIRPNAVWEGDAESFSLYRQELVSEIAKQQKQITEKNVAVTAKIQQIIKDRICPACETELHDEETAERINAGINQEIKILRDEATTLESEMGLNQEDLHVANEAQDYQLEQNQWLAEHKVELNNIDLIVERSTIPFALSVTKPPEEPKGNVTADDIALLIEKNKEQQSAIASLETDRKMLDDLKEKLNKLNADLIQLQQGETTLILSKESTDSDLRKLKQELADMGSKKETLDKTREAIVKENELIAKSRETLDKKLEAQKTVIKDIQRNSGLISAVREARINISNLLWQKLLGVTETYFSLFRGKPSKLSISKKGILVDNHLSAPSGSTLDILGIALRLAIGKLFADSSFCALDEPSAGCDVTRTAALAAGLISANLEQTIMVTHKDMDEQIGNLIIL